MTAVHPRSGMAEAGGIDWHLFLDYHFHLRLEKLPREQLRTALAHFRRASRAHGHCGIHFGQILAFHEIAGERSEEHTSELQSLMRSSYAVFCLKKKNKLEKNLVYKMLIDILGII